MITRGTKLEWHCLRSWIACAHILKQRHDSHISCRTYQNNDAHWLALDIPLARAWIKLERDEQLLRTLLGMLHSWNSGMPWCKPRRGHRGGTKWESVNCETKNRLQMIERERDHASMVEGHNYFQK